jgi:deoxyribonuclease V
MVRWPDRDAPTPREAMQLQELWRARVLREAPAAPRTIAGVDVGVRDEVARAAIVVLSWPGLEVLDSATAVRPVRFPYVPGLLGFREVPCLVEAYGKLSREPDLMLVDGQGLAHPRGFGVATHLGVELDRPTIGCAKSLLCGEFREPGPRRGASTRLLHRGELIGRVVRTREGVRPLIVSIGHRTDLETAVRLVLRATRGFRLPEPIRAAHRLAAEGGASRAPGR